MPVLVMHRALETNGLEEFYISILYDSIIGKVSAIVLVLHRCPN